MADKDDRLNSNESNMADPNAGFSHSEERLIEIHVNGQLGCCWSEWFDGLEVKLLENGEMILFGPIEDQAALMGVLNKLNRLNLTLLSLTEIKNLRS